MWLGLICFMIHLLSLLWFFCQLLLGFSAFSTLHVELCHSCAVRSLFLLLCPETRITPWRVKTISLRSRIFSEAFSVRFRLQSIAWLHHGSPNRHSTMCFGSCATPAYSPDSFPTSSKSHFHFLRMRHLFGTEIHAPPSRMDDCPLSLLISPCISYERLRILLFGTPFNLGPRPHSR